MPYGKPKTYRRKTVKKFVKKTYKKRPTMSKKSIKTMVKKEIASNIENKISSNVSSSASILNIIQQDLTAPILDYYVWNPYFNGLFNTIIQGPAQSQRIGNTIKLKRWVIKGSIYYDAAFTGTSLLAFPQNQMYIDLYFGRKLNLTESVLGTLDDFYQSGSNSIAPYGQLIERTYGVNKDEYKVYWHKRYKVGAAGTTPAGTDYPNNDYKLNREFGFDVCKLVCKNKKIKYNDSMSNVAEDALIQSLSLWAVGTMPNTSVDTTLTPSGATTYYSPVRIQANTYVEYEDA